MKLQLVGKVVSVAMQKTVRVVVTRIFMHPKYEKLVRKDKGYLVHNENPDVALGDMVRIEECRPMSKHKHFILRDIVKVGPKYVNPKTGDVFIIEH